MAVLALILAALGSVLRYKLPADLFATVDRTLAERARAERPLAELDAKVESGYSEPVPAWRS